MIDILKKLVLDVKNSIKTGYYDDIIPVKKNKYSLKNEVLKNKISIISEIKFASPSAGIIRDFKEDPVKIAYSMQNGGAIALSILTEEKNFNGSLRTFSNIANNIQMPLIMKDIIFTKKQIDAGKKVGADAILLIYTIFRDKYTNKRLEDLIDYAHNNNLEVILECHNKDEFNEALTIDADIIGINNRDLKTFNTSLNTTKKILENQKHANKCIISESGIESYSDIQDLLNYNVNGFLIGSSIMSSNNIETKLKELINK